MDQPASERRAAKDRESGPLGPIGSRIGFILHTVDLLHMEALRGQLGNIGLTPARATAIALVVNNPGLGQSELARILGINRASATEMIDFLENLGAVERVEGTDRRSKDLHPTAKGRELYEEFDRISRDVDAIITAGLAPAEQHEFDRLLKHIGETLTRHVGVDNTNKK